MHPLIFTHDNVPIEPEEFYIKLHQICKEHRENNRALAFAFILSDFTNENISKILDDKDYWMALNELSGNYLTVFYLHCERQAIIDKITHSHKCNDNSIEPNRLEWLQAVNIKNINPRKYIDEVIIPHFKLAKDVQLPCTLFFETDGEDIVEFFIVELKKDKLEETYIELKGQLSEAVERLKNIDKNNYRNRYQIFQQLRTALESRNKRIIIGKIIDKLPIKDFLSLLFGKISL